MLAFVAVALLGVGKALCAASSYASRPLYSTIEPSLTQIEASAATAASLSPTSDVKGIAFDRFYQVWLENTVGPLPL
jgi:acid phosphatase